MGHITTFLLPVRAWLDHAGGAGTAFGTLCVFLFLAMLGLRKWAPTAKIWERVASVIPAIDFDVTPGLMLLNKIWQSAFPTIVAAVIGALASGGNPWVAAVAAIAGPVTVFGHEFAKWLPFLPYRGAVNPKALVASSVAKADDDDDDKTPPSPRLPLAVASAFLLCLAGCGLFSKVNWPAVVAHCVPSKDTLIADVTNILLNYSSSEYPAALEKLAETEGGEAVACAVNGVVNQLGATTAKLTAKGVSAIARGKAFLAAHGVKSEPAK